MTGIESDRYSAAEREQAGRRVLYLTASLSKVGFYSPGLPVSPGDDPGLGYLARYVSLVQLLAHGERLLDITERIYQRPAAIAVRAPEARPLEARGAVDWWATMRGAWRRGEPEGNVIVSQQLRRHFETEENLLLALSLRMVRDDAERLCRELGTRLAAPEQGHLHGLSSLARKALRHDPVRTQARKLDQGLLAEPDEASARRLEAVVAQRARQRPRSQQGYLALVGWRQAWRIWLTGTTTTLCRVPILLAEDHRLYELLVLLEVATAFSRHARSVTQTRSRGEHAVETFRFTLNDGRNLELWFQATKTRTLYPYVEVQSRPDMIIVLDGRAVLCEAKSNLNPRHDQAVYTPALNDLMAYLFNFGRPTQGDCLRGGLAIVPQVAGTRFQGYGLIGTTAADAEPWLASIVIPFTGADAACEQHLRRFVAHMLDPTGQPPRQ